MAVRFLQTWCCSASVFLAFSFLSLVFLGLFGTFYLNESKLIVFRNEQMLLFSSHLRMQLFELYFNCKKGLLDTVTCARQS